MLKPSIKTIIVKNLVNFLLILAMIMLIVTGINFRALSKQAMENQALAHAELVKSGLTAHMKGGIMDKRDYYLEEIRQLHEVNALHIIRGDSVTHQFGLGKSIEKIVDKDTKEAFDTKEPVYILNEFSIHPSIRAIIPYIAHQDGPLNCLICHKVEEGTVLGAVDIELDVTSYRNHSLLVLAGLIGISFTFFLLMLVKTSRTIQQHVKMPLETLIEKARVAYKEHDPVSSNYFATREFTNVADEINLFNTEIIANQEMLQQKNEELLALNDEIESTVRETVYTMGVIEEQRSKETNYHSKRVSLYCNFLASHIGLSEQEIDLVTTASPLHDIGKLGIPDEILLKPDKLNSNEREIIKNHTRIGYAMLRHSKREILQAGGIIALQHHEKWDGSGYPQSLIGEDIHIFGRVVALADVFDALISARVYKESWDLERVVNWITNQREKHFDPTLVDIFLANVDEFIGIFKQYPTDTPEEI
jgi:response regulator RpfG family c-di-GMP phosphodiesterase